MESMEFDPSQLPISQTFQVDDEYMAPDIAQQIVKVGFATQKGAFRIIITKEKGTAKKIGFTILNELNQGLKRTKQERDIRYWIHSHDTEHYAMVLISSKILSDLGF